MDKEAAMITIRQARIEDVDVIYRIQQESFKELHNKYQDTHSPYMESKERLLEKMERPLTIHYLIYWNRESIGFSRVKLSEDRTDNWLGTTAILPAFQKKGYGYQAIREIEKQYPATKRWSLDTILQEEHLVRLYKKLGFVAYKTEPVQEGMDLVYMEKLC